MPAYDFRCKNCGHKFSVITGINDRGKVSCTECKGRDVEQIITGCTVLSGRSCSRTDNNTGFGGG